MDQKRRQLLHAAGGLGVLGLLATAGLISPAQAQAAAARPGFDARELNAALAALGAQDATASTELSLTAPDIAQPLTETVEAFERALIADALRRHGSLARTAEALSIAKTTLHDKIRKYGLQGD